MLLFLSGKIQLLLFLPLFFKENKGFEIMPLIECPDCKKQVSDQAPACPNCGCPISSVMASDIQTIEATGKAWKGMQLCGGIFVCIGVVSCIRLFSYPETASQTVPVVFLILGCLLMIIGKFGAWWEHE